MTIRVFCNPYSAGTDHKGRLHGRLQYEPDHVNGDASLRFIGARVTAKKVRDAVPAMQITEDHDHTVEYVPEPVVVQESAYYLRALQHMDLLPADKATHRFAYGTEDGYRDPLERLAQLARERGVLPSPEEVWRPLLISAAPIAVDSHTEND